MWVCVCVCVLCGTQGPQLVNYRKSLWGLTEPTHRGMMDDDKAFSCQSWDLP